MPQGYVRALDLPQVIPVFPLGGAILLPRGQLPLNIFEPRYLNMVDDAMAGDRMIGMVQTRAGGDRERPVDDRQRGREHLARRGRRGDDADVDVGGKPPGRGPDARNRWRDHHAGTRRGSEQGVAAIHPSAP